MIGDGCDGRCLADGSTRPVCGEEIKNESSRGPQNWTCTLPPGHDGSHVACSSTNHNIRVWGSADPVDQPMSEYL